jgi:hypothetical protein
MKTLQSSLILLTAILVCALTFNANAQAPKPGIVPAKYRPVAAGEPAPYAGILTDLQTYRAESAKFKAQAALIDGQKQEIAGLKVQLSDSQTETAKSQEMYSKQLELTQSAQLATATVNSSLQVTQKQFEKAKPRWYEKPVFLLSAGFIAGGFVGIKYL